jgi:Gly-Xaa carboxypeptidase
MGSIGEDKRWEAFGPFHDHLVQSFPLTCVIIPLFDYSKQGVNIDFLISHKSLTLIKVNTYGLLYEWKGSDDNLKPLLLAAHQGLSVFTSIASIDGLHCYHLTRRCSPC